MTRPVRAGRHNPYIYGTQLQHRRPDSYARLADPATKIVGACLSALAPARTAPRAFRVGVRAIFPNCSCVLTALRNNENPAASLDLLGARSSAGVETAVATHFRRSFLPPPGIALLPQPVVARGPAKTLCPLIILSCRRHLVAGTNACPSRSDGRGEEGAGGGVNSEYPFQR